MHIKINVSYLDIFKSFDTILCMATTEQKKKLVPIKGATGSPGSPIAIR
jgi:hypothetical protein